MPKVKEKKIPVQVKLSPEAAHTLNQIAFNERQQHNTFNVGIGTIVARLVEGLLKRDDLIQELNQPKKPKAK